MNTVGLNYFPGQRAVSAAKQKKCRQVETEEEEIKQQQSVSIMADMARKIKRKGRMDAKRSWWVSELLVVDCKKGVSTNFGRMRCSNGITASINIPVFTLNAAQLTPNNTPN